MRTPILNPIIIITEGPTDAPIICSLVDMRGRTVYSVVAGGFHKIASTIRTQYLMHGDNYYYVAAFDSDSDSLEVRKERLEMISYLSKADMHSDIIRLFCFRGDIEKELRITKEEKRKKDLLIDALKERGEQMKQCDTIKEIQEFINGLRD